MSWVTLLIVGVVALIVAYFLNAGPPALKMVLNIVGWVCIAIALILLLVALLGAPLGLPT